MFRFPSELARIQKLNDMTRRQRFQDYAETIQKCILTILEAAATDAHKEALRVGKSTTDAEKRIRKCIRDISRLSGKNLRTWALAMANEIEDMAAPTKFA